MQNKIMWEGKNVFIVMANPSVCQRFLRFNNRSSFKCLKESIPSSKVLSVSTQSIASSFNPKHNLEILLSEKELNYLTRS